MQPIMGEENFISAGIASPFVPTELVSFVMEPGSGRRRLDIGRLYPGRGRRCEPDEMGIGRYLRPQAARNGQGLTVVTSNISDHEGFASSCLLQRDRLGIDAGKIICQRRASIAIGSPFA